MTSTSSAIDLRILQLRGGKSASSPHFSLPPQYYTDLSEVYLKLNLASGKIPYTHYTHYTFFDFGLKKMEFRVTHQEISNYLKNQQLNSQTTHLPTKGLQPPFVYSSLRFFPQAWTLL